MRILITGGTGYIGSHTALNVLNNNFKLLIIDNHSNSSEEIINKISHISKKNFEFKKGDIKDKRFLQSVFKHFKPEIVIHFAGLKSVKESASMPIQYYSNNVLGTVNLLEIMNEFNCHKIIFSSSATVYGIPVYLPCDEKHQIKPINPYGRSKYFIEEIIRDWTISKEQNKSVILRYFNQLELTRRALLESIQLVYPTTYFHIFLVLLKVNMIIYLFLEMIIKLMMEQV